MALLVFCVSPETRDNVTRMFQKSGGHIYSQTEVDFSLNPDVVARKDKLQGISVTYRKGYDHG